MTARLIGDNLMHEWRRALMTTRYDLGDEEGDEVHGGGDDRADYSAPSPPPVFCDDGKCPGWGSTS
jgi:hypothetical protein